MITWLFTQVWLWSLAAFVLGALITWLLFVRPLRRRLRYLAELSTARGYDDGYDGEQDRDYDTGFEEYEDYPPSRDDLPDHLDPGRDDELPLGFLHDRARPWEQDPEPVIGDWDRSRAWLPGRRPAEPPTDTWSPTSQGLPSEAVLPRAERSVSRDEPDTAVTPVDWPGTEPPATPDTRAGSLFDPQHEPAPDAATVNADNTQAFQPIKDGTGESTGALPQRTPGAGPHPGSGNGPVIKGHSASRQYHGPDSPSYHEITADVWFRTAADAEIAGFLPWNGKRVRGD